jgi:hypothetical protein
MDVINELEFLMTEKKLSPVRTAQIIGCSQSQIYRWLKRITKPGHFSEMGIRKGIKKIQMLPGIHSVISDDQDRYRLLKKKLTLDEKQYLLGSPDYPTYQKRLRELSTKHNIVNPK